MSAFAGEMKWWWVLWDTKSVSHPFAAAAVVVVAAAAAGSSEYRGSL